MAIDDCLTSSPAGGVTLNVGSIVGSRGGIAGAVYTAVWGLTKDISGFDLNRYTRRDCIMPAPSHSK